MPDPTDELRLALPSEDPLTRRARADLAYYRGQAELARERATEARKQRRAVRALDALAAAWDALGAELEAFADQQTPDHGETLL